MRKKYPAGARIGKLVSVLGVPTIPSLIVSNDLFGGLSGTISATCSSAPLESLLQIHEEIRSFANGSRAREIRIRVASGASPAAMRRLVVKESVELTAIAVALGIPAAVWIGRGKRSVS